MAAFRSAIVLSLLSTTVVGGLTRRSICHPGRQTIDGVQYTISCGLDRLGGDYDRDGPTTWDQCIAECAADAKCVTAQYHEDDSKFCYFKNTVNDPVLTTDHYTIDRGVACQKSTTLTLNGQQCSIQCGVDRHGGNYDAIQTGNYLACASACAGDSNCITAQYNEGNVSILRSVFRTTSLP